MNKKNREDRNYQIKKERGNIITDLTEIRRIKREQYKQLYANNWTTKAKQKNSRKTQTIKTNPIKTRVSEQTCNK